MPQQPTIDILFTSKPSI